MDVMPSRPEIFLLADTDRRLVAGGPALVGPDRDELRLFAGRGDLPVRSDEYVDWVKLSDVLAFNARLNADREQALLVLYP